MKKGQLKKNLKNKLSKINLKNVEVPSWLSKKQKKSDKGNGKGKGRQEQDIKFTSQ